MNTCQIAMFQLRHHCDTSGTQITFPFQHSWDKIVMNFYHLKCYIGSKAAFFILRYSCQKCTKKFFVWHKKVEKALRKKFMEYSRPQPNISQIGDYACFGSYSVTNPCFWTTFSMFDLLFWVVFFFLYLNVPVFTLFKHL